MSQDPIGLERGWTRRQLLTRGAWTGAALAAAGAAGYTGYRWPRALPGTSASAPPAPPPTQVDSFVSRPDLRPPRLTVAHPHVAAPPVHGPSHLLLAPKGYTNEGPGQAGAMIVSRQGRLVWFRPAPGPALKPMNLRLQRYRGEPVLTWWEGAILDGRGLGSGVIYDGAYKQIATVSAGNGLEADLHEFLLTDRGTALLTAYETAPADLTAVGGPAKGWVYAGHVQEVDVASGDVLMDWSSLDHVGVAETLNPRGRRGSKDQPFDYFHVNSIAVASDGNLLVSARNTCAVYKLDRRSGAVIWRLGGRRSDFAMNRRARFYWQHDARVAGPSRISLFDDGSSPARERYSRGLLLHVDERAMRAAVVRQYVHPARLLADNQGSMQVLADGRAVIGWGAEPYVSEFTPDGRLRLDSRLPENVQTYRAVAGDWVGRPADVPAVKVGPNNAARGATVYVSWNGATRVASWRILAGARPDAVEPAVIVPHSGFETAIAVAKPGPYYVAVALDGGRRELGRSAAARA